MLQPTEDLIPETDSRAKELDHGTIPMSNQNVMLGLPIKPGIQFDDRSSVEAIKWTYDQLVSQKILINTISVPVGKEYLGKPLFVLPNTWSLIRDLHFRKLKDLFYLNSWKWHLTFEFQSNFQQVGLFAISYVNAPIDAIPYLTGDPITPVGNKIYKEGDNLGLPADSYRIGLLDQIQTIYQLPHTLINMGENQTSQWTFNWLSPFKSEFRTYNYAGTIYPPPASSSGYDMGHIRIHAIVPLNSVAEGEANNLTIRIWSHLTEVKYAGYVPTDDIL